MSGAPFSFVDRPARRKGRRVLVHSFSGFMDAGSAAKIAVDHLAKSCETRLIGEFDSDAIIDYRARRPRMTFEVNKFTGVEWPTIRLHEVSDDRGARFLLLSGPEPDYRWQAFTDTVLELVEELNVDLTVGLIGIPWPAPHTRPVGVSVHATDPDLIRGHPSPLGSLEIPGHVAGLLELRLGEAGCDAMGLAVQVPHYLVQFDYPRAAIALLRGLAGAAGLSLSTDGLEEAASTAEQEIERQTQGSEEFAPLLSTLESQYDAATKGEVTAAGEIAGVPLLDAEQIGAQVERFLAEMDSHRPDSGPSA
ncbi:MAG: PAC2 family protein [Candidatus Nanopelagicales bacterium]|nr:PAC2 family protein [Candidatus Nanopelagicales bacterium]MDZ4249563.1 PAC2 family protein [Candidatus Nanopelagicales bacterium]